MKTRVLLKLAIFAGVFALATRALAQEAQPGETMYIVQPGDTLTSIASRFELTVDDIIQANDLADPNQLFVGTELLLPNVDWVRGVLDARPMVFGETLRSLAREYRVQPETLARLAGLSSPAQLGVGYPVLLPTQTGEDLSMAREVILPGLSLLEIAAANGQNPWAVVSTNQLLGTWDAITGDVLLLPGTSAPGPAGLPSQITEISFGPQSLIQGHTTVVHIQALADLNLSGQLVEHSLNFFTLERGSYVAMQGVHAMLEPGYYPLSINASIGETPLFAFTQLARVEDGGYDFETITVDPEFLNPIVEAAEAEIVNAVVLPVTPEKLWSGYFQAPTPFADTINSLFGTRRSYNGSGFDYYHAGVDFGGGVGVQIYAPAVGRVVFAGPLEVRGNATIIDHGWGVYTGYWHQSEINVQVGDAVQPGQRIGLVGNTGRSSGGHLHWELWVGGVQVDPLDWLAFVFP